ncbi:hypothetical protein JHD47_07580 [Sulfurimonas sp. SAG-AH-194-L11]|nr:hypothetical protein [Sulfurimonas sp. SAG-AH-194-L11]MDF1877679.1 hypothetical protein [Sulfurimonas sp. SAG-AH-194-L11]
MFDSDILLSFSFMGLLFLRQIVILKQPNKINYAPLMIGVGSIATLVHFIIHPESADILLIVRESLFPLLVSLLLYIIMNILHQTQLSKSARTQEEFIKVLVSEITQLKEFIYEVETKMTLAQEEERAAQEEIRAQFKEDIRALDTIENNQTKFITKFEEMRGWDEAVSKGFKHFTQVQLPGLDDVLHKHIDILRVAEQDHYNKLHLLIQKGVASNGNVSEDIESLKENLQSMKNISNEIANSIVKHTLMQLSGVTKSFESQIIALKSHTESVTTSLKEGESTLANIRVQSEMIMKQMILSANKMNELEEQNSGLHDVYATLKEIIVGVESVKSDYIKSQAQLSLISAELAKSKDEQVLEMRKKIDDLSESLRVKIDESLEKLHEHFHITDGEISPSVQILAKRAQLKSGYGDIES